MARIIVGKRTEQPALRIPTLKEVGTNIANRKRKPDLGFFRNTRYPRLAPFSFPIRAIRVIRS